MGKHIKKDYQKQFSRHKTKENMTSLCLRNQRFGHKFLSLQKPTFEASSFAGRCNVSMQKPQIEITAASVTG